MLDDPDVTVVGAGPSGLTAAVVMARMGVRVQVVDRSPAPITEPRAMFVQTRTLELWERLGIADGALRHGSPIRAVVIQDGDRTAGRLALEESLAGDSVFPHALGLPQDRTQRLLLEALEGTPDADVAWGVTVEALEQDGERVILDADGPGGPLRWDSRYVVAADGGSSTVRGLLGIDMPGHTSPLPELGVDLDFPGDMADDAMVTSSSMARGLSVMPIGDGRYRAFGTVGPVLHDELGAEALQAERLPVDAVRRWFRASMPTLPQPTTVHRSFMYRIHERVARRFREGRVFLVGDAAHMNPPAGGQGINLGMGDGYNLGWKLALVLRGEAHETLPETYEEERLPLAQRVVRTVGLVYRSDAHTGTRAARLSAVVVGGAQRLVLRSSLVQRWLATLITQLWIRYPAAGAPGRRLPVPARGARLRAGDRVPTHDLPAEVRRRLGHVLLVVAGLGPLPVHLEQVRTLVAGLRVEVGVHRLDPRHPLARRLGGRGAFALVRPDGHVGVAGDVWTDRDATADALHRLYTRAGVRVGASTPGARLVDA